MYDRPDYKKDIPEYYNQYQDLVFGPGGKVAYIQNAVRNRVKAMKAGTQGTFNQARSQYAGSVAARGGLGSGGQDAILSDILVNRQSNINKAAAEGAGQAESQYTQGSLQNINNAQQTLQSLSSDKLARLQLVLQRIEQTNTEKWRKRQMIADAIKAVIKMGSSFIPGGGDSAANTGTGNGFTSDNFMPGLGY